MNESNTYYLESQLGWSGVAVEALSEFAEGYRVNRPRTKFVAMFASDAPDTTVSLFVPPSNSLVASSNREFTVREGTPGVARTVPTTTLTVALEQAGVDKLDFMSMDIELSEPKALKGFDIDRFQPAFVCIESHPDVRQAILDYFADHQYVVVGKYLRMDPNNLYFRIADKSEGIKAIESSVSQLTANQKASSYCRNAGHASRGVLSAAVCRSSRRAGGRVHRRA